MKTTYNFLSQKKRQIEHLCSLPPHFCTSDRLFPLVVSSNRRDNIWTIQSRQGFSLIELALVMAIISVLTLLAVPAFKTMMQSNAVTSTVNLFLADVRYARAESMRRGVGVIMCRSDYPEQDSPVCASGAGNHGWSSGWIIFQDLNDDGVINPGEPILRIQSPIKEVDSIMELKATATNKFRFTVTGRLRNLDYTTSMRFGGSNFSTTIQSKVCVGLGGRARIAGDGYSSCGTDNQ